MNAKSSHTREERPGIKGAFAPLVLGGVLSNGETLLWAGRPDPFRIMRNREGSALFGMVIIILLTMTPLRDLLFSSAPSVFRGEALARHAIVGAVALLAAWGLLEPFRVYCKARGTVFVLTDRRILHVRHGNIEAAAPLDDIEATCHAGPQDEGDVQFLNFTIVRNCDLPSPGGFFGIRDAQNVYRLVLGAKEDYVRTKGGAVPDYLEFLLEGRQQDTIADRS